MTAPVYPAWANAPARTLAHHDSDETVGIASASVDDRRARAGGHNELEREPGKALWRLVLEQFDDALVKVLLAAAAVSNGSCLCVVNSTGMETEIGKIQ